MRLFEMAVPNIYVRFYGAKDVCHLLEKNGVHGVAVNTIIEELTDEAHGSRFPSMVDRLNRPIEGQAVIYVRNHSSFDPDMSLYSATGIKPPSRSTLPELGRDTVYEGLQEARKRGAFHSIMDAPLAIPPQTEHDKGEAFGYPWWAVTDEEYKAVRIDGKRITGVESKACPNHPSVRSYARARLEDIARHYPGTNAIYVDHIEFPTYTLEDSFSCFCAHCLKKAEGKGFDLNGVRDALLPYFAKIERLTAVELDEMLGSEAFGRLAAWRWANVRDLLSELRAAVKRVNPDISFGATGFTAAFSKFGSRDYREIADLCDVVLPKFYPEHWTVVLSLWIKKLCGSNPFLTESEALTVLYRHLGWGEVKLPLSLEEIDVNRGRVLPMELIDLEARRVKAAVGDKAEIRPPVHGWGSLENWRQKLRYLARNDLGAYIWVLFHVTDEQLAAIKALEDE